VCCSAYPYPYRFAWNGVRGRELAHDRTGHGVGSGEAALSHPKHSRYRHSKKAYKIRHRRKVRRGPSQPRGPHDLVVGRRDSGLGSVGTSEAVRHEVVNLPAKPRSPCAWCICVSSIRNRTQDSLRAGNPAELRLPEARTKRYIRLLTRGFRHEQKSPWNDRCLRIKLPAQLSTICSISHGAVCVSAIDRSRLLHSSFGLR